MVTSYKHESEWKQARLDGIGASEASCIVGCNPYKTNIQLWEEKTGRTQAKDISDKPAVQYGKQAESHLRELFMLDFPEYTVTYDAFGMVANLVDYPWLFATLDGEISTSEGANGVLEIKTTEIRQSQQWKNWDNRIPQMYYIQVLHQLLATGYNFAILKAQIKWRRDNEIQLTTRHYTVNRDDVLADLNELLASEIAFWECVQTDCRPNLLLSI